MRPALTAAGAGLFLCAALTPLFLDCYAGDPDVEPAPTGAPPEPLAQPVEPLVTLDPAFAQPSLPLDAETLARLTERDLHAAAERVAALDPAVLTPEGAVDRAFLLAWLRAREGHPELATALLPEIDAPGSAPRPYVDLLAGELLLQDGQPLAALARFEAVPETEAAIWPRARVLTAEALYRLERTADSRAVYEALAARPDPAEGTSVALLTLARRAGFGSPEAYPLLRRLWRAYPGSPEDAEAGKVLAQYEARGAAFKPTLADRAARAQARMDQERWRDAITLLSPAVAGLSEASPDACKAWYVLGRSQFKANDLTGSLATLAPAGEACVEHDAERGAKALYLAGKVLERRKDWGGAARLYERIPALYPGHSMADDGYALAGIGWQESGDMARAIAAWSAQVAAYPDGDMAAEGFWRLAWNAYLQGDTAGALAWADQASLALAPAADPVHRQAALYWRWRWRLYPDRERPAALTTDPERLEAGIAGLLALCRDHPASFYALLSAARLQELAPERLAALPAPGWSAEPGPWQVRQAFLDTPAARNALALARIGLLAEAVIELEQLPEAEMIPGEVGSFTDIMSASGQWLWAHDLLRRYLDTHAPETLASDRARLLLSAYPPLYGAEVGKACEGYAWDQRLFHALVREESNFNKDIVSHAGARGLSQLMPATARGVARWLGTTVSDRAMFDPATNLRIGARYLEYLMGRYGGDPFLSLAGYNAGEGNVDKWLRERGNRPVDEFVESIPLRETRHYVKRVSSTWQMYRLLYAPEAPPFPSLSAFNAAAVPSGG